MRFFKIILLLLLFVSPLLVKAQLIEWRKDRPLTWDDFRGKPDYGRGPVAVTYSYLVYSYNCELKDSIYKATFGIQSIFDTQRSWVKRSAWNNEYILGHEQLHFDIDELFARKLAAAFHSTVFTSNYAAEIKAIFDKYWSGCEAMEAKYDAETNHSDNRNMQLRWQLYIYLELEKLPRNY